MNKNKQYIYKILNITAVKQEEMQIRVKLGDVLWVFTPNLMTIHRLRTTRERHTHRPQWDLPAVRPHGVLRPDGDPALGVVVPAGSDLPFPHRKCVRFQTGSENRKGGSQSGRVSLSGWSCPLQKFLGSYCFICFACVCLLGGVFTFFVLPETRGKTLVEISTDFRAISVCGLSLSQQSSEATKLWETAGTASSLFQILHYEEFLESISYYFSVIFRSMCNKRLV